MHMSEEWRKGKKNENGGDREKVVVRKKEREIFRRSDIEVLI